MSQNSNIKRTFPVFCFLALVLILGLFFVRPASPSTRPSTTTTTSTTPCLSTTTTTTTSTTPCPSTPSYRGTYEDPDVPPLEFIKKYGSLYSRLLSQVIDFESLKPRFVEQFNQFNYSKSHVIDSIYPKGNDMIGPFDFYLAYSMTRLAKPKRVIEVGSGHSTTALWNAIKDNEKEEGIHATLTCIEPFRSAVISQKIVNDIILFPHIVQSVDVTVFTELESGDVLYLDGSHVMAPFGDTIYVFLFVLPLLKKGVCVHIHDIFLPENYPEIWQAARPYTEQWALALFLYKNPEWEILFSNHFACTFLSSEMKERISETPCRGGSIWLRKIK